MIWIWFENHSYNTIIGSSSAPYINSVATECGLATNYHNISHPSLPNYISGTSGLGYADIPKFDSDCSLRREPRHPARRRLGSAHTAGRYPQAGWPGPGGRPWPAATTSDTGSTRRVSDQLTALHHMARCGRALLNGCIPECAVTMLEIRT